MKGLKKNVHLAAIFVIAFSPLFTAAQQKKEKRKHEFYFSWGYNTEWYTHSNLHISQPSLGNDYTFENVNAHDHRGWDGQFFTEALSIPQYNYRLGYFINEKKQLAIEINFDHTKYIFADNQMVHIKGAVNGKGYDGNVLFKENPEILPPDSSSSYYFLNNGANFLLFNLVKRWHWISNRKGTIKVDALAKAGIGPVIPHVQNKFFNQPPNDQGFQFGGWNTGVEGAVRATFFNYVYLEYTNKLDYARYSGLQIYEGTAKQAFGTYEMILNLGVTFSVGKKAQ
jgi:hypothetical protein